VLALKDAQCDVVILDNLSNSSLEVIRRLEIVGGEKVNFVQGDVIDELLLDKIFQNQIAHGSPVECVVHFAALKAVAESVALPVDYYSNNVAGTLSLLKAMDRADVKKIVFSSSATVYGVPQKLPFDEQHRIAPTNPYGWSKAMVEQILKDWTSAQANRSAVALRYFNPIGAHSSGHFGEAPNGVPNNLFPYITQVAVGKRSSISIFGRDYPTIDGTGVRDYLHVQDLADGHIAAINYLRTDVPGFQAVNLGTGRGTSVLELISAFEKASGRTIPYLFDDRRAGDVAEVWADARLALTLLGWSAKRSIGHMCEDGWRWQKSNPDGYSTPFMGG
jgi:UDP-glucose 4-epimerase